MIPPSGALLTLLAVLAVFPACRSPHHPDDLTPLSGSRDGAVLALVNGEAVTRGDVAAMAMKWHQREYLEEYILWKLRERKIRDLKIENTPQDMRERARVELEQTRRDRGEDGLKQFLSAHGMTEASLQQWWIDSGGLGQKLLSEKLVTLAMITEETIEVDLLLFPPEMLKEAQDLAGNPSRFSRLFEQESARPRNVRALQIHPFPAGMAPEFIDKLMEQTLFSMPDGQVSPAVSTTPAGHAVVRMASRRKGTAAAYRDVREEVMRRILEHPPESIQITRWLQRLRRTSDVRYNETDAKKS